MKLMLKDLEKWNEESSEYPKILVRCGLTSCAIGYGKIHWHLESDSLQSEQERFAYAVDS